jgi:hypothetical protein
MLTGVGLNTVAAVGPSVAAAPTAAGSTVEKTPPTIGPVTCIRHTFPVPAPVRGPEGVQGDPAWLSRDHLFGASIFPTVLRTFRADEVVYVVLSMAAALSHAVVLPPRRFEQFSGTPATRKGSALEGCICAWVGRILGLPVLPGQVYYAAAPHTYVRVSLDGEVATTAARILVEAKCMFMPDAEALTCGRPPLYRLLQCQLQCAVVGAPYCLLCTAYLDTPEWEAVALAEPVSAHWPAGRGKAVVATCRGWAAYRDATGQPRDALRIVTVIADRDLGQALLRLLAGLRAVARAVAEGTIASSVAAVDAAVSAVLTPAALGALSVAYDRFVDGVAPEIAPFLAPEHLDTDVAYVPVVGCRAPPSV